MGDRHAQPAPTRGPPRPLVAALRDGPTSPLHRRHLPLAQFLLPPGPLPQGQVLTLGFPSEASECSWLSAANRQPFSAVWLPASRLTRGTVPFRPKGCIIPAYSVPGCAIFSGKVTYGPVRWPGWAPPPGLLRPSAPSSHSWGGRGLAESCVPPEEPVLTAVSPWPLALPYPAARPRTAVTDAGR